MEWPAELATHRDFLRRLAVMQMGNPFEADDAVQETLIAAALGLRGYSGAVPMRAWLVGILRHKIVDVIRSRRRMTSIDMSGYELDEHLGIGDMFSADGAWQPETLGIAECPADTLGRQQLLDLVELCMQALPPEPARIFLMREYLGMETSEIAAETELSPGNLRVILHRARLRLRACVVRGWGETR